MQEVHGRLGHVTDHPMDLHGEAIEAFEMSDFPGTVAFDGLLDPGVEDFGMGVASKYL